MHSDETQETFDRKRIHDIENCFKSTRELLKEFPKVKRDPKSPERLFPMSEINDLVQLADFLQPMPLYSHRKILGPIVILAKRCLQMLCKPFIKILFAKQIYFNQHMTFMAHTLIELEDRLRSLDERLKLLESKR